MDLEWPRDILDITPDQLGEDDAEPHTMLEAMRDGERTRRLTPQAVEEPAAVFNRETGEPREPGATGLPGSLAPDEVRANRAQSGDQGQESETVAAPDSIRVESLDDRPADVHSDRMASEKRRLSSPRSAYYCTAAAKLKNCIYTA